MIAPTGGLCFQYGTILPVHNLRNTLFLPDYGLSDVPLMISVADLTNRPILRRAITKVGIKTYLGITGPVMIDSGGFSFMSGQYSAVTADDVVGIYRDLGADLYAALDLPPNLMDNARQREKKWRATLTNLERMLLLLGPEHLVPVIHGRTLDEISTACQDVRQLISHPQMIALGGIVPFLRGHMSKRRFGYERADGSNAAGEVFVADAISICRKEFPSSHLHVFGVGSTTTAIAVLILGADSVDSLAWRRAAGYGTIFLPGLPERIISQKPRARRSRPRITLDHRAALENCKCPVCAQHPQFSGRVRTLSDSYIARAVHNVWTLLAEQLAFRNANSAGNLAAFSASRINNRHRFAEIVREHVRNQFLSVAHSAPTMRREGAASRMEPILYDGPPPAGMEVPEVM